MKRIQEMPIQPRNQTGPGILFGKKRTMNSEDDEPSRYGPPLCVLTRFRAFHGRSLWAFLGPANAVCYAHRGTTLVYLGAETVKRRIKKSTMRQVRLRLPLTGPVLSPPSFPLGRESANYAYFVHSARLSSRRALSIPILKILNLIEGRVEKFLQFCD